MGKREIAAKSKMAELGALAQQRAFLYYYVRCIEQGFILLLIFLEKRDVSFSLSQPVKIDLNKKSLPKQKTIQNFTIDA